MGYAPDDVVAAHRQQHEVWAKEGRPAEFSIETLVPDPAHRAEYELFKVELRDMVKEHQLATVEEFADALLRKVMTDKFGMDEETADKMLAAVKASPEVQKLVTGLGQDPISERLLADLPGETQDELKEKG